MLVLLIIGMLSLAFNIQPAKSEWTGTVYIRADGSIDPPDAPLRRDGNIYTLTDNIVNVTTYGIVIQRSNIILDGAGHVLQGSAHPYDSGMLWKGDGVILEGESNVTIRNLEIKLCNHGVFLGRTSSIKIYGNKLTNNDRGIRLHGCLKENYVFKNRITSIELAYAGIYIDGSSNSWVFENNLIECNILLENSTSNRVYENNITEGEIGLSRESNSNSIFDNKVVNGIIAIFFSSHNNTIYQNFVTHDDGYCISLDDGSSYNNILENNITASGHEGISLTGSSSHNHIIYNNIRDSGIGIMLHDYSSDNTISKNSLLNNSYGVMIQFDSKNNIIYNNNFINNTNQVYVSSSLFNIWDSGYPSGGNYWSDYNGTDLFSGAYQNETGSDGLGDTSYEINENNIDRYPLMHLWTPKHELAASIVAPVFLGLGDSSPLKATVTNRGSNDEVNMEFLLLINGTTANSTVIPLLRPQDSYTLNYLWTPSAKGIYNVTAYISPVENETFEENNRETRLVIVSTTPTQPEAHVGVKAGDWIKVEYTITGWPSGQPYPKWLKVEFLSVEGTNATVRVTMHMSDGTDQNDTVPVIVGAGGGEAFGLSGFVIPANLTVGDSVYISGYGNVTLAGETTRTYAGASRTVVYASFSQYGTQLTYYWDKQTGVMVEAYTASGGVTATAKATETNMWQPAPSGFPIEPIYIIAIAIIIIIIAAAILLIRKRKT